MNSRIKEVRISLNLTQTEFARELGIAPSSVSDIERGYCPLTNRTIISICSIFNVNEQWLRSGQGQMFVEDDKKFKEFFEIYKQLSEPLQDFLIKVCHDLIDTQEKL